MSPLPNIARLASKTKSTDRQVSHLNTPSSSVHEHDTASELRSTPDRNSAPTWPATRSTSHQPSEGSDTTMPGAFYDGGAFDNASSVTLEDEFPWHEVGANKYTQRIPATIVPALLQSRTSLDGEEGGSREADEDSSDSEDDVPRYSASQKGKWKAQRDGDVMRGSSFVRSPSPHFHFDFGGIHNSVGDWAIHSRPILQDYADRQTSLPLGRRLEVSIDEPPQFILGAVQLLVNRDKRDCADRSRRIGPQLIENFVNIDRWAKEYFRSHHGTQVVDSDVPALLTIVMNNFYEGLVQLIDRLVEFALENMRFCGRSSLGIEDFAFGFDFRMSQDLPFYVETSSRIREPLPIRAVVVRPTSESVTTSSGRQVKPTERAQAASEQAQANANRRRDKGESASEIKGKEVAKASPPPPRQKKNFAQPSLPCTEAPGTPQAKPHAAAPAPSKTTSTHTKFHPMRPSNLRLPPILSSSSSTAGTTSSRPNDSSKSEHSASASAGSLKGSSSSGSNSTVNPLPRLKIRLPPRSLPTLTVLATSGSELTSSKTNSSTSQANPPANAPETTNRRRGASRSGGAWPRGPRNGRGRGRGLGRKSAPRIPSAEASEAIPDNIKALPTTDAGNEEPSAAVDPPVGPPTLVDEPRRAVGMTPSARPHVIDRIVGTRDDGPTPRRLRTGKLLLPSTDPGHPRGKKRKLDDCED